MSTLTASSVRHLCNRLRPLNLRRPVGFCSLLYLAVAILFSGIGLGKATTPAVSITFAKSGAQHLRADEGLSVYLTVENLSEDELVEVKIRHLEHEFFDVKPLPHQNPPQTIASGNSIVKGFHIVSKSTGLTPGKYTTLFDIHYRVARNNEEGRLIKELEIEVRNPLQDSITLPKVTVNVRPSSDTLREKSKLYLTVLVENTSAVELEQVELLSCQSPVLTLEPHVPVEAGTIKPFETWTSMWTVQLEQPKWRLPWWRQEVKPLQQRCVPSAEKEKPPNEEQARYGKHSILFQTTYKWKYGSVLFTSMTVTSVDITASFFGDETLSKIFGVPLNLIVFVLPGFCLLWGYNWAERYWKEKEYIQYTPWDLKPSDPTTLLYSVFGSILLLFFISELLGINLYEFFTLVDLFCIAILGVIVGAGCSFALWLKWKHEHFSESERSCMKILKKALARQPNVTIYKEYTVKEKSDDVEFRGILLSEDDTQVVLGPQFKLSGPENIIQPYQDYPKVSTEVEPFFKMLRDFKSQGVDIDLGEFSVTIKPTNGEESKYLHLVKVFDATAKPTLAEVGQKDLIAYAPVPPIWIDGAGGKMAEPRIS